MRIGIVLLTAAACSSATPPNQPAPSADGGSDARSDGVLEAGAPPCPAGGVCGTGLVCAFSPVAGCSAQGSCIPQPIIPDLEVTAQGVCECDSNRTATKFGDSEYFRRPVKFGTCDF